MTEQQTTTDAQAATTGEAQAATTTTETTTDAQAASSTSSDETTSTDDGAKPDDERVTKANREAAKYRTELRKAQEKLEAIERERMTETEKAQADALKAKETADALVTKAKNALGKAALTAAAADAKLIDPSIVHDLLAGKLEFDEDGEPTNVADLVKSLVETRPYLVNRGGPGAGGAPGAGAPSTTPATESRADFLKRMKVH